MRFSVHKTAYPHLPTANYNCYLLHIKRAWNQYSYIKQRKRWIRSILRGSCVASIFPLRQGIFIVASAGHFCLMAWFRFSGGQGGTSSDSENGTIITLERMEIDNCEESIWRISTHPVMRCPLFQFQVENFTRGPRCSDLLYRAVLELAPEEKGLQQ